MNLEKLRVAIPTKDRKGLDDSISEVFGKAKTFTIIDIENNDIKNILIIDNPASSYEYGSGPIVVKTLVDLNVKFILAVELGPGALSLLEHHGIKKVLVKSNIKVKEAIKEFLAKIKT